MFLPNGLRDDSPFNFSARARERVDAEKFEDPQLEILCTLPEGPIRVLQAMGNVLYAETDGALYQINRDGSYIGVKK